MKTKECFKCKKITPLNMFYKHSGTKDKHLGKCKDCTKNDNKVSNGIHERKCVECSKKFRTTAQEIKKGGGLSCSRICYIKRLRKIIKKDKDHHNWKGDEVGIGGLHDWVRKKLGKPSYCEHCKRTDRKNYDWSNISRNYIRKLSDWQRLCRQCHIKYDGHVEKRKNTLMKRYGTLSTKITR